MIRILRYMSGHKRAVAMIIVFLLIQAACDIALPQYTSDIVDIGIEQGGIDTIVPTVIRESSIDDIKSKLTAEDASEVTQAYELNGDYTEEYGSSGDAENIYSLTAEGEKQTEALEKIMGPAMAKLANPQLSDAVLESSMSESIISQTAHLYVQDEYKIIGVDMEQLQMNYLKKAGGMMLLISVIMMFAAICNSFVASRAGSAIGRDLRAGVFRKVVSFSSTEIDRFSTASLITRCTNDIQQIQMVCIMILRMVLYAPIIGIGGIIKVMSTHTGMSWIIGIAVLAIVCLVSVLMSLALPKFKIMQVLVDKLNLISREILTGLSVIRAFNRQEEEEKRFNVANTDLMKTQLFANRVMTFMMPVMMMIMNCVSVLIVWQGAKGVDLGNLQVGDMIAFITYTMMIVMAFLMLTMISIMLPRAGVAAARIDEILNTEAVITDKENVKDAEIKEFKGEICFENVSFRYPGAEMDVIENISFTAEAHKTTAFIGSTGSGKSTLVNLIPRFYDVTGGRITLDGVDIRDLSQHKLREAIGLVPQKGILFSGTIESNLKYADENIPDEIIKEAAQVAQASEFIASKSDGYSSAIAQEGSNVSGGQRQRLAIARAIAKNPAVYLFDDSFSALDYKTDAALRHALSQRREKATTIIVAQRISTIMHADKIVVMDEGHIAGMGTHEELMKTCSEYQEIANSQLSKAELEGGAE